MNKKCRAVERGMVRGVSKVHGVSGTSVEIFSVASLLVVHDAA